MAKHGNYHKTKTPFKYANRRDIPYSIRLTNKKILEIGDEREDAARVALYIAINQLHKVEGFGYERITRFSVVVGDSVKAYYRSATPDVEQHNMLKGLQQRGVDLLGLKIAASGDLVREAIDGKDGYRRELDAKSAARIKEERADAAYNAIGIMLIELADQHGFGEVRLNRFAKAVSEATNAYYAADDIDTERKKLEEDLIKIGFMPDGDKVIAIVDEDKNPIKKGSATWQRASELLSQS